MKTFKRWYLCKSHASIINKEKMLLIQNARLINERKIHENVSVLIKDQRIHRIYTKEEIPDEILRQSQIIQADNLWLLPGVIDDQVHFREPGLTHKGDIYSESRAAIAGGITSFMDMPNTIPQTVSVEALNQKFDRAAEVSFANYTFFIGATNNNLTELKKIDAHRAAAIKVFMGSSTGNMLVDNGLSLERIFCETDMLIAAHCESEFVINRNIAYYTSLYGNNLDVSFHPKIRSVEACYASSSQAVDLANKYDSRLHLFHLSTWKELELLENKPLRDKKITGEVCVHHLWFSDDDYKQLGNKIKWNPAIKTQQDRDELRQGLINGKLDVVATDHAPHLLSEKQGSCLKAASGGPLVQHSLPAMLELCKEGIFSPELVVEKMCHAPAELFRLKERGYIREGYYADLVLIDPDQPWEVSTENLLYKCGWSPFENQKFSHKIVYTIVNGYPVYVKGQFDESFRGMELERYS